MTFACAGPVRHMSAFLQAKSHMTQFLEAEGMGNVTAAAGRLHPSPAWVTDWDREWRMSALGSLTKLLHGISGSSCFSEKHLHYQTSPFTRAHLYSLSNFLADFSFQASVELEGLKETETDEPYLT